MLEAGWAVSLIVKQLVLEANHSPSSCAEVKNGWSYTFSNPMCLHGMHKNIFTVTLTCLSNPFCTETSGQ